MGRAEFAIIGVGQVSTGNYPERSEFQIAYEASRLAIRDAGIDKNRIGGAVLLSHIMGSDYNTEMVFGRLPEAVGLKGCRITCMTNSGGASSFSTMLTAESILRSGETDYVLLTHAQRFSQFSMNEQAKFFAYAGADAEFEVPYGMTYNALAAMMTQAYMDATGTTLKQVASVVVSDSKWGARQKNGRFYGKEQTVDKVVGSQMVSYPLTSRMCNVLADGGGAYIMTTAENAARVSDRPVYFLSHASDFSHRQITKAKTRDLSGLADYLKPIVNKAYERAGLGPEDMDLFEIYGSYPGIALMIMDALGVCAPGESGKLFAAGETWPGGKYQASTNGEAISFGHLGAGCGFASIIDAVLQLQGRAGEAQASGNPRFLIKNTGGGAFMDAHFTVMGNENV